MTESVTKFLKNQEEAVKLAREIPDDPSSYSIRVDAINAALSMNSNTNNEWSVSDVIDASVKFEAYLKSGVSK